MSKELKQTEEIVKTFFKNISPSSSPPTSDDKTIESMSKYGNLFPFKYSNIYEECYVEQRQRFWTEKEVNLTTDRKDFESNAFNDDERKFVKNVFAFFANADNMIPDFVSYIQDNIPFQEVKMLYNWQKMMEDIHALTYQLIIDQIISSPQEKGILFNSINNNKYVQKKLMWIEKWIEQKDNESVFLNEIFTDIKESLNMPDFGCFKTAFYLILQVIVEGLFFWSAFAAVFWVRLKNKCPGLCFANSKIVEDESCHVRHAAQVYLTLVKNGFLPKLPHRVIHRIFKEAINVEFEFIKFLLPNDLLKMNSILMNQHIRSVADMLLGLLDCEPLFGNAKTPFEWLQGMELHSKSSFFEVRTAEYQLKGNESQFLVGTFPDIDAL